MQTTVDFLRHGEVTGSPCYRGSTDDPLTEHGWQQMHDAVAGHHWDVIISSPLLRCLEFAELLNTQSNTLLSIDPNWQEIHFGDWEGKTAEQINSDELMRFYQDPMNNTPNNAENLNVFINRINLAWQSLLKEHSGKHILVISHAGVIRCLFNLFLNLPTDKIFSLQLDHAGLTRFQCFNDKADCFITLVFSNLTHPNI